MKYEFTIEESGTYTIQAETEEQAIKNFLEYVKIYQIKENKQNV
jgi:hypothetical protein